MMIWLRTLLTALLAAILLDCLMLTKSITCRSLVKWNQLEDNFDIELSVLASSSTLVRIKRRGGGRGRGGRSGGSKSSGLRSASGGKAYRAGRNGSSSRTFSAHFVLLNLIVVLLHKVTAQIFRGLFIVFYLNIGIHIQCVMATNYEHSGLFNHGLPVRT
ncbi:hypothetical protein HDE_03872 [Halotydeus destructor]|nr:hypothetical protein HDE_03872 [Halotydeus destructor]